MSSESISSAERHSKRSASSTPLPVNKHRRTEATTASPAPSASTHDSQPTPTTDDHDNKQQADQIWTQIVNRFEEEAGDPPDEDDLDFWESELLEKLVKDEFLRAVVFRPGGSAVQEDRHNKGTDLESLFMRSAGWRWGSCHRDESLVAGEMLSPPATAAFPVLLLPGTSTEDEEPRKSLRVWQSSVKALWHDRGAMMLEGSRLCADLVRLEEEYFAGGNEKYLAGRHRVVERLLALISPRIKEGLELSFVYFRGAEKHPELLAWRTILLEAATWLGLGRRFDVDDVSLFHVHRGAGEEEQLQISPASSSSSERLYCSLLELLARTSTCPEASRQLAIFLLQSNRSAEAAQFLKKANFEVRFREKLLRYWEIDENRDLVDDPGCNNILVLDNCLRSEQFLAHLRDVFDEDFFRQHCYDSLLQGVNKKHGYFSYTVDISEAEMESLTSSSSGGGRPPAGASPSGPCCPGTPAGFLPLLLTPSATTPLPKRPTTTSLHFLLADLRERCSPLMPELAHAKHVEIWTHRRPRTAYHQMHFDSENEGIGGAKNPIATFVLFLNDGRDAAGGDEEHHQGTKSRGRRGSPFSPTLITDQALGHVTETLHSAKAYLVFPKSNRAVCFRGNLLHGVIPGRVSVGEDPSIMRGTTNENIEEPRATLMFSFWKELTSYPGEGPGTARPLEDVVARGNMPWTRKLRRAGQQELYRELTELSGARQPSRITPQFFPGGVWETVDGEALVAQQDVPYSKVFQF